MKTKGLHYVEEKLQSLTTIKERDQLQTKAAMWKQKANMKEINTPGPNDFRTQISAVVKMQKDAEFISAIPEFSFLPENEEARKNRKVVREAWNYWWLKTNTDKQIGNVISSATTFGTGILYEGIRHIYKTINTPYFDGEELKFKTEKVLAYSGIYTEKIPFENFFINGTDIDTSTEAVVITYYDKSAYIAEKELSPLYKNLKEVKGTTKLYNIVDAAGQDINAGQNDGDTITELKYYNVPNDEYIIVANGIEILKSHIPYTHKELPFCLFIDNKAEDRIYGIGEFEMLDQDERYKNELRTLLIKGVKASIGFLLKDSEATFEEDTLEFGIGEIFETSDVNGLKHFAQNVPLQAISQAEKQIDNDVIIKSGIDINSQITTPETATKTAGKTISGKKRVNKNIKDNAYDFYRRLAYLRMKNIQFIHTLKVREIPIKGGSIKNDGVFIKDESGSHGFAKIGADLIGGEYLVLPIVETMIGDNKQRRKDNAMGFTEISLKVMGEDGKPVVKGKPLIELLSEEFGYDFEKMTKLDGVSQSGEDVLNSLDKKDNGISSDSMNPSSPDFIPPEQRSGAKTGGMSGQAKLTANDLILE